LCCQPASRLPKRTGTNITGVDLFALCCGAALLGAALLVLQYAALDLVELDRLEQCAEITFAEALVALALDDLEEDRSDHGLRENLQQQFALRRIAMAVDQDAQALQFGQLLAVIRQAAVDQFVIGFDGV